MKKEERPPSGRDFLGGRARHSVRAAVGFTEKARRVPTRKVGDNGVLKPEEFEVFSRLRDWRKTVAAQEGARAMG